MDIPLLDFDKLIERMEGDLELIREIFDIFVAEAPERRAKFEKALLEGDSQAMVMLSHSLKGASGTLHAEPLRQACYDLEHAARAADAAKVAALTPPVMDMLEKTAARIDEIRKGL